MGESRTELLTWLNDLLQLNYTKIEQCGTGAALCQIMDSIYPGDVPLRRVNFTTNLEYEYIQNFKILQQVLINMAIPVQRLMKCRFQDNLEFLQWMKKFWDTYYSGNAYDAVARRNASAKKGTKKMNSVKPRVVTSRPSTASSRSTPTTRSTGLKSNTGVKSNTLKSKSVDNHAAEQQWAIKKAELEAEYQNSMNELSGEITGLKATVEALEKERDFYFGKLRDIEVLIQNQIEISPIECQEFMKEVQTILYSTEDGFEIPDQGEELENQELENPEDEMF
ncbi:calponin homology domain-containing protein [Neocallimastix lanati (nom. inval.)]|nr:calponin homology domain-containing protein [Neocallimastix sp. JGI-2020a]